MSKDCAFQYATGSVGLVVGEIIEDTDLITLAEATALWNKYLPDFKQRFENGERPEMCIWTGMENNTDYHTDKYHIDADECVVEHGKLYVVYKSEVKEL